MKFLLHRAEGSQAEIDASMERVDDLVEEIDQCIDRHPGLYTEEIVSALVQIILGRVITTNPANQRQGFAEALKGAFSSAIDLHFPDQQRMN
jgi:hypothetical protein